MAVTLPSWPWTMHFPHTSRRVLSETRSDHAHDPPWLPSTPEKSPGPSYDLPASARSVRTSLPSLPHGLPLTPAAQHTGLLVNRARARHKAASGLCIAVSPAGDALTPVTPHLRKSVLQYLLGEASRLPQLDLYLFETLHSPFPGLFYSFARVVRNTIYFIYLLMFTSLSIANSKMSTPCRLPIGKSRVWTWQVAAASVLAET